MKKRGASWWIVVVVLIILLIIFKNFFKPPSSAQKFDRHITRLIYTKHARCRMDCRHIDESEVKEILEKGTINNSKSEPDGKPDPKYALEGTTHDGQHVRIVFAPSNRGMVVITVIDIGEEWQCNCN